MVRKKIIYTSFCNLIAQSRCTTRASFFYIVSVLFNALGPLGHKLALYLLRRRSLVGRKATFAPLPDCLGADGGIVSAMRWLRCMHAPGFLFVKHCASVLGDWSSLLQTDSLSLKCSWYVSSSCSIACFFVYEFVHFLTDSVLWKLVSVITQLSSQWLCRTYWVLLSLFAYLWRFN